MAKLTLSDLTNLSNENSAVTTINNNSAAIETALENTLSRDGTSPNSMGADLDLNSNDILNVASLEATTIEAGTVEADNFTVDGVSLNILLIDWEGQWLTATSYAIGDVVYNNGSSYICTVAHESAALTQPGVGANWEDNWDLIVQKGEQGIQGIPGDLTQAVADTLYQPLDSDLTTIAGLAKSDGNFIVGNGTDWVTESAGTARTSLGLGASDSPQFLAVNIQATDTTITRFAAGDISVEGNRVYRAGGADVTVADGGTGASSASAAATNLGLGTGDTPQFTGVNIGATDTTITRTGAGDIAVEGNAIYRAGGTDVPVADGGSGRSTATEYAVICGGTTATGAHQSIASVGTAGHVLTSNGAGALPTFQVSSGGASIASVTSNLTATTTTFANVTGLSFAVATTGSYWFRATIFVNTNATADSKFQITGPTLGTGLVRYQMYGPGDHTNWTFFNGVTAFSSSTTHAGGGGHATLYIDGIVQSIGGAGGTFQIQWAQNVASGTSTLYAGSYMLYQQVA